MTPKFFYFHNPKSGGTSIIDALKRHLPAAKFSPQIENNTADHKRLDKDYSAFFGYDIYAGHYGRDVFDFLNDNHSYFTSFRNPADRIISLYKFFRSLPMPPDVLDLPHHLAVRVAKNNSILDFIQNGSAEVQVYVCNAHFRQLTSSLWETETLSVLKDAFDFIDGMKFIYVVEYVEQSLRLMSQTIGVDELPRLRA